MLYTIAVVLFILWILGFGVFHVAGALIHILLIAAIILNPVEPDLPSTVGLATARRCTGSTAALVAPER